MKHLFGTLVVFLFLLGMISCDNSDSVNLPKTDDAYFATLTGQNMIPSNESAALGRAVLKYNNDTKTFNVTVYYTGITVTGARIHKLERGVTGSLLYTIPIDNDPLMFSKSNLNELEEYSLKMEQLCIILESKDFPNGEIWGRFTKNSSGIGSSGETDGLNQ